MKEKNVRYVFTFLAWVLMLLGVFLMVAQFIFTDVINTDSRKNAFLYGGIVVFALGLILLVACIVQKHDEKKQSSAKSSFERMSSAPQPSSRPVGTYGNNYHIVHMGSRQTAEEKFNEIAKMDKTQFVIYVARLFGCKGYQVKFTPVLDNYGVDLLVEKMGVTLAVGCYLANKVLCERDIASVVEGSKYYHVGGAIAVTNMYFDRSVLEFAKKEKMSLVDRNILAEDFMK